MEVNVRKGPNTVFERVGFLRVGESAKVAGRESSGNWWYIEFPAATGGFAWVWAEAVTPSCIPADLQVVATPPTPTLSIQQSDLKITDIYADAAWKILIKIVNDGPSNLKDAKANLNCGKGFIPPVGFPLASVYFFPITITLDAGKEKVIDPNMGSVSSGGVTEVNCEIIPDSYTDPNPANNSRANSFTRP
jgi:hypothetical protein